jgi:DNA-binding response OmpR family regulator
MAQAGLLRLKGLYVEQSSDLCSPNKCVLVVEDEPTQRLYLETLLSLDGYECHTAATCAEGRERFQTDRFALVLLDLGLPDGSGLDLLGEFTSADSCLVPIVLTGDGSTESVIGTLRAGAFDFLIKPVDKTTLMATLARGYSHYTLRRERLELLDLLVKEKEQLEMRVAAATADIRQYATACETSNARLRSLLALVRLSASYYSAEMLMRHTIRELGRHLPVRCLALCDVSRERLLAVWEGAGDAQFTDTPVSGSAAGYEALVADAEPARLVQEWVSRNTGFDISGHREFVFPQALWNRSIYTVGFYLAPDSEEGPSVEEYLGMCAHFLASEWEQSNLLLHVAHHASVGSIAVELARSFVQPLTALRTAADFVAETIVSPDGAEGMEVMRENIERLRRQTQEFRKLSLLREDCVETVRLDEYIDQALDILAVAIQNRGVTIEKDCSRDCECILLNGTALARTFLDLILSAVRSTQLGGRMHLRLSDAGPAHVAFEIAYDAADATSARRGPNPYESVQAHPGLQLAERTIHSCGGTLAITSERGLGRRVRVVLPRNATHPSAVKEFAV